VNIEELDQWVRDRHLDYASCGIEIGDPLYEWELAHHPVPRCEGGTEMVPLLKSDHAVHGVLQSEVFQRPCIYSWEHSFLEGELLTLWKKWMGEKGKRGISKVNTQLHADKDSNGKSLHALKMAKVSAGKCHVDKNEFGRSKHWEKTIGASNKRKSKKTVVTDTETNEIYVFESCNEAARILKVSPSKMSEAARGLRERAGKFKVEYDEV
jgi:hypothetical protein